MTRRLRRLYAAGIAIITAAAAVVFLAAPSLARDPAPPRDAQALAAWMARHPADWPAASSLANVALDSTLPRRIEVWHAAHDLAMHLAPQRPKPTTSFVRSGLFHWYELSEADRRVVLEAAAPLLRDPATFRTLYGPLFELTRNFAYLRRNAPPRSDALAVLAELAVTNGLFAEYREVREAQRRERWSIFESTRHTAHPGTLLDLLPSHLDARDEPLVRAVLEEIDRKPLDPQHPYRGAENLAVFALRHRVPLTALVPFIEMDGALNDHTRARVALALGDEGLASKVELTSVAARTAEWVPYHLDRALAAARRGDRALAEAYLARSMAIEDDVRVLSTGEQVATILGDAEAAARFRRLLEERAHAARTWSDTCAPNELCTRALTREYVTPDCRSIRVAASVVQTDQVPPYVELYVDDALAGEGEITAGSPRVFELAATPGLHRVEVRLVNPWTRNRIQRRVRLS